MRMCKRAALCAAGSLRVASVSTAAHTGASVSSLTWAELSEYSKAISQDAEHTYTNAVRSVAFSDNLVLGVGDYLNISIGGVNYRVDIIGFHHDEATNSAAYGGAYAGITWQMHGCYATNYAMNGTATNAGGWRDCVMRTSRMPTFMGMLESQLQNVIVAVNKKTGKGGGSSTLYTTGDSLFLTSEIEIWGYNLDSANGEGTQYSYYAAGGSKAKVTGGSWSVRSPALTDSGNFRTVYVNGGGTASSSERDANTSNGVALAFCT